MYCHSHLRNIRYFCYYLFFTFNNIQTFHIATNVLLSHYVHFPDAWHTRTLTRMFILLIPCKTKLLYSMMIYHYIYTHIFISFFHYIYPLLLFLFFLPFFFCRLLFLPPGVMVGRIFGFPVESKKPCYLYRKTVRTRVQ